MKKFETLIKNFRDQRGQITLILVVVIIVAGTVLVSGIGVVTYNEVRKIENVEKSSQSLYAAEAGIEDALLRVKNSMNYSSNYTLLVGSGSTMIDITGPIEDINITSRGNVNNRIRKVAVSLDATPSDTGVSFLYGVQVGDGGLFMENTASIVGSVYSSGNITSSNNPTITGDAFASGTSTIDGGSWPGQPIDIDGNAKARVIREARVGGNAVAFQLTNCQVGGTVTYDNSVSNCSAGGGSSQAAYTNLPDIAMPISDGQLDTWEQEAEAGGVINGPCPYQPANGSNLGPVKINCDLLIDDNQVITMTGAIWVVGNMTISNQSRIQLASSFGDKSSHIIIDNPANRLTSSKFIIQNDAQVLGSGDPDSFVLIGSRNNSAESGGCENAIVISNQTNAPIYYSPHGKIIIENNTDLFEATAYRLHLKNSGQVTYKSGLANANFTSGVGGTFNIRSWAEIQ